MTVRSALSGLVVARVRFSAGGIPWEFTMHGRTNDSSANTSAKMAGLASEIDGAVSGLVAARLNDANTWTGVAIQDLSPARLPDEEVAESTAGTRGSDLVPQSSCVVVTKRTAKIGRAFRGRCYLSGGIASDLDSSGTEWDAGWATSEEQLVDAVRGAFGTASPQAYTAVIYHRKAGQDNDPPADTVTPITAVVGRTELGQQKSRRG